VDAARRTDLPRAAALALMLLGASALPAHAGQVRVSVGSGGQQLFAPYAVNVNIGDQVAWVWIGGNHTVTSWTLPADSINVNYDGAVFDSDAGGTHFGQSGARFSWKSDRLGHVPYVCVPHMTDMSGRIIVSDPNVVAKVPVADFRITEVQYNIGGGADLIEITNLGAAAGDLGRFRIATGAGTGAEIPITSFPVPSDGRVTIHNNAGSNDATNIYNVAFGNLGDASGSVALYMPYTLAPGNALTNTNMIVDFVQWGAGGQGVEATAVNAGMWGAGTFIPTVAAGHSIEYCANPNLTHGVDRWAEIATPNFGGNGDCTTPVSNETWGRLKTIYRR
jgi:plastocyanin